MNWYNKFLKISHRNPLDKDAIALSEQALNEIKRLYSSKTLHNQTVHLKPEVKAKFPLQLNEKDWTSLSESKLKTVDIIIENLVIDSDFVLGGRFLVNNTLTLTLRISKSFSNDSFKRLYMELFNIIRHEIRHLYDNSRGKSIQSPPYIKQVKVLDNIRNASVYLLARKERLAYIEGLVLKAKRSRVSFSNLVANEVASVFSIRAGDYRNPLIPQSIAAQIQQIEIETIQEMIRSAKLIYPKL